MPAFDHRLETSPAKPPTSGHKTLGELGWNSELAENLEPGLVPGRVAAVHRGAFDVWTEAGAVRAGLPGRLVHEGLDVGAGVVLLVRAPVVGDTVERHRHGAGPLRVVDLIEPVAAGEV